MAEHAAPGPTTADDTGPCAQVTITPLMCISSDEDSRAPADVYVDARPYLAAIDDESVAATISRADRSTLPVRTPVLARDWLRQWAPHLDVTAWEHAARDRKSMIQVTLDAAEALTWLAEHRYGPTLDGFLRLARWIVSVDEGTAATPEQVTAWLSAHAERIPQEFWTRGDTPARRAAVQGAVDTLRADALALLRAAQAPGHPPALAEQVVPLALYLYGTTTRVESTMSIRQAALCWAAGISVAEARTWGSGDSPWPAEASLAALAALRGTTELLPA